MAHVHSKTRECLSCSTAFHGRSDKRFCTNSCKAHHSRAFAAQLVTTTKKDNFPHPQAYELPEELHIWSEKSNEIEDNKWDAFLGQVRYAQAATDAYHHPYALAVEDFLHQESFDYTLEEVDQGIEKVERAISNYLKHSGLRTTRHIAHKRLFHLYLIHDHLLELLDKKIDCDEVPDPNQKEVHMVYIDDYERFILWEGLLGIANTDYTTA